MKEIYLINGNRIDDIIDLMYALPPTKYLDAGKLFKEEYIHWSDESTGYWVQAYIDTANIKILSASAYISRVNIPNNGGYFTNCDVNQLLELVIKLYLESTEKLPEHISKIEVIK